ncbi:hypothetical protein XENTR_v10008184 [Xenopus tropicalis]|nr:hypothetical protein XENTR_v10008184 [Xenopus tropicalis]
MFGARLRALKRVGRSSPDPRADTQTASSVGRRAGDWKATQKHRVQKRKPFSKFKTMGKIKENIEKSKHDHALDGSTSETAGSIHLKQIKGREKIHSESSSLSQVFCSLSAKYGTRYLTLSLLDKLVHLYIPVVQQEIQQETDNTASTRYSETTSGITLPTLYQVSSESETSILSTSVSSCLSPEVLRGADSFDESEWKSIFHNENLFCKNSTLLETSQAVNIDFLPEPTDVSNIFEPIDRVHLHGAKSNKNVKSDNIFEKQHVSTIVSGKKIFRITREKEKTPRSDGGSDSKCHTRPEKKVKESCDTTDKNVKCKKRVSFGTVQTTEIPPNEYVDHCAGKNIDSSAKTDLLEQQKLSLSLTHKLDLSPVCVSSMEEEMIPNTSGPFVHSIQIAPSSTLSMQKESEKQVLHETKEICCIIKAPVCRCTSAILGIPIANPRLPPKHKIPKDIILTF